MAQYKTGTIACVSGEPTVVGSGTLWKTGGVSAGFLFKKKGENVAYTIASVPSETQIVLSANYAGSGESGKEYQITRDYTDNLGIPEIWAGDIDWPYHLTTGLRKIDTVLGDRKYVDSGNGEVTTVDATPTVISTYSAEENHIYAVEVEVLGRCTASGLGHKGKGASYFLKGSVKRYSGEPAFIGTFSKTEFEEVSNWDVNVVLSSSAINVQVTGMSGETINWRSKSKVMHVS